MSKPDHLPTLSADTLVTATGGATRSRSSSNDQALQQTLTSITDSLRDLKNQSSSSSLEKVLPLMVAAKVIRDRG